ncbi:MAG: hypothetical protein JWR69_2214 [Pedosphaera sp.]|nr:hypothetical protein [Pedosphaera sp.]
MYFLSSRLKSAHRCGGGWLNQPLGKSRIILQDKGSQLYFQGPNAWINDLSAATNFEQIIEALEFVRREKLANLDIIMSFGDPRYDIRLTASP